MKVELLDAVKQGVADPPQAPSIHDLMHQAIADVVTVIQTDERLAVSLAYSDEELGRRTEALEEVVAPVVPAAAWGGFYGAPNTKVLWPGLVGRLANGIDRSQKHPHTTSGLSLTYTRRGSSCTQLESAQWRAIVPT